MHSYCVFALSLLPLLVSAHFHVLFPSPRSDDESSSTGPCGGFPVSDSRTQVSVSSFPVALEMGHDRTVIQMLLALGNEPGDNFNITLEQTFQQQGEGGFCLPDVPVPESAGVTEGMNGTLQVVTDGEGGGGLYVCADITFVSATTPLPDSCKNGTGIVASPLPNMINANESTADGQPQSGSGGSSDSGSMTMSMTMSMGPSATESADGAASTSNEAAMLTAGWALIGGAVVAAAALL